MNLFSMFFTRISRSEINIFYRYQFAYCPSRGGERERGEGGKQKIVFSRAESSVRTTACAG